MEPSDPRVDPSLVPEGSRPVIMGKDQPEYLPLPAIKTPDGKVITRWKPSAEDLRKLAAGEDVFVTLWTFGQPMNPIHVAIGPSNWR